MTNETPQTNTEGVTFTIEEITEHATAIVRYMMPEYAFMVTDPNAEYVSVPQAGSMVRMQETDGGATRGLYTVLPNRYPGHTTLSLLVAAPNQERVIHEIGGPSHLFAYAPSQPYAMPSDVVSAVIRADSVTLRHADGVNETLICEGNPYYNSALAQVSRWTPDADDNHVNRPEAQ